MSFKRAAKLKKRGDREVSVLYPKLLSEKINPLALRPTHHARHTTLERKRLETFRRLA